MRYAKARWLGLSTVVLAAALMAVPGTSDALQNDGKGPDGGVDAAVNEPCSWCSCVTNYLFGSRYCHCAAEDDDHPGVYTTQSCDVDGGKWQSCSGDNCNKQQASWGGVVIYSI